jgi:hypothetical protein
VRLTALAIFTQLHRARRPGLGQPQRRSVAQSHKNWRSVSVSPWSCGDAASREVWSGMLVDILLSPGGCSLVTHHLFRPVVGDGGDDLSSPWPRLHTTGFDTRGERSRDSTRS